MLSYLVNGTSSRKITIELDSLNAYLLEYLTHLCQSRYYMGDIGSKKDLGWIERVKSGGAVPLLDLENYPNGWATPSREKFMVRGPAYFSTKVKILASEYLLKPLGFDWIKSSKKIGDVLNNPDSHVRKVLEDELSIGDKPFI